jgi:hypothetical protein
MTINMTAKSAGCQGSGVRDQHKAFFVLADDCLLTTDDRFKEGATPSSRDKLQAPVKAKAAESMEQRAESEKQKIGLIGLIGPIIFCSEFLSRVPACGCGRFHWLC